MLGGLFDGSARNPDGGDTDDEPRLRTDGGVTADASTADASTGSDASAGTDASTGTDASVLARLRRSEFVESLPFWGPPAVLVGIFVYGAVAWNLVISLIGWNGLGQPEYTDFSLAAYEELLVDASFASAFWNTLVLLLVFTALSLAVGLLLAILIDRGIRFENTFRTIYLLPMSLSFVVTAIFWSWMYNPRIGLINTGLRSVGLDALTTAWLSNPDVKLFAIIFALMWQFSGYCMVVYLAGLRAIPRDQYEAARIDGASTLRVYLRVIIPQLGASTMSAAVVLMVFALKAFDFLFVLFGVNPGESADILSVMMYRVAFDRLQWSYGAAVATVLFAMALSVIGPYLYAQYRRGEL